MSASLSLIQWYGQRCGNIFEDGGAVDVDYGKDNVVDSSDDVSQYKWEHWPSPASPQEMGLQCTKKDWPRLAKIGQVATFEGPKLLPIVLIVAIILIPMSQMNHPTMYHVA